MDSRTILDTAGAEKLLGRGDMLYQPLDANKPARVQGVFLSDQEIGELINHWKSIPWARVEPIDLLGESDMEDEAVAEIDEKPNRDDLMDKAMELALSHRKLSTSLLQRRLRIGYPPRRPSYGPTGRGRGCGSKRRIQVQGCYNKPELASDLL